MNDDNPDLSLSDARRLLDAAASLTQEALDKASVLTERGRTIDDHQVLSQRVAYAATETRAAKEALDYVDGLGKEASTHWVRVAGAVVGDLSASVLARLDPVVDKLDLAEILTQSFPADVRVLLRRAQQSDLLCQIGRTVAKERGKNLLPMDETLEQVRRSVQKFADKEVTPHAERIHRHDQLVPEQLIEKMSALGYFGLSIPESYGGFEMGNLAMILTTEELSHASLAAAGSLITRPEILAKALLSGGTEEQKKKWLPLLASGELMVGISVTEPNVGSDVAQLACRAEKTTVGGHSGWQITGAKSWCTFAGRANILAVLARTNPDAKKGAQGLSLFIVEKDVFLGHEFDMVQKGGGRMQGKADATPGYRGMHSFTLSFENYFVPADNLVGLKEGEGRGFYLQMAGFAAGRLQTGGRACGLAQAALETTAEYVADRRQFGRAIAEFELTQHALGLMATRLFAARVITYAAAVKMDEDERKASLVSAQAKLFASDVCVEVTQKGQLLHGGWGYAEEYAISRQVVDALVLPIFEGVKPILELKVIARGLFAAPG